MSTEAQVLNAADLAKILNRTEAAIRASVNRQSDDIPPRLLIGRRICWRRETVQQWLKDREQPAKPAKVGRKVKATA
jgi:predicted DNA-binding transcriptional regulator AlpA